MFAQKTTTRVCHFCQAPNPVRLHDCYSCGRELTELSPNLPKAGDLTFACVHCHGAVPLRAEACPYCSHPVAPVERVWVETEREAVLPKGWRAKPLPNDTVLLKRTGLNIWRVPNIALLLVPGFIAIALGVALYLPHGLRERAGEALPFLYAVLGVCAVLGLAGIVLPIVLAEEILLGRDFLEVRRSFLFYRFRRRIEGGYLQVKTERHGRLDDQEERGTHVLQADDYGKPLVIREIAEGIVWSEAGTVRFARTNEASRLGLYIAEITRWRLYDEAAGRYGE